jgi:hypothetical protein
MKNEPIFVSFKKNKNEYNAFIAINELFSNKENLESLLKKASTIYSNSISRMVVIIKEINAFRNNRRLLPATKVWELGDIIFNFVNDLNKLSLQIDGIYEHLERDLNVKRKWLEKVIIFRRYITKESMIPESLNWGKVEKGTRKKAQQIQKGIPV